MCKFGYNLDIFESDFEIVKITFVVFKITPKHVFNNFHDFYTITIDFE